jgi:hypothetical protein
MIPEKWAPVFGKDHAPIIFGKDHAPIIGKDHAPIIR